MRNVIMLCAVFGLWSGSLLHAQTTFNLVDGQPIHTQAQMDSLKTGDTVVMVCPMCKAGTMTTYSSDSNSDGHVKWMQTGFSKTCAICGGTIKGVKKDGKMTYHCSKCNDAGFVTAFNTAGK